MSVARRKGTYHIRPTANKEPDWSSICNNVFYQYLDEDDLFAIGGGQRERSSSDDSGNLFDFSGSSEQSNTTSITSPLPSWDEVLPLRGAETEAKQPKAKAPGEFWTKKLRVLEQNAAECEKRQQKLRNAKSNPDFLSLGGYPSPPAIPSSPTNQSYSAQRSRSRVRAANGRRTPTQRSVTNDRSVPRGRPTGVTKPPASATINPYATIRKSNASPSKMMNPSRYRAGFKDIWAERIEHSPKKYELRLPLSGLAFPDSPPPSARLTQDAFAAFGSPVLSYLSIPGYDEQISPLANTFQQAARLHTPTASPLLSPGSHAASSYFDAAPPLPRNSYNITTHTVPLNDTAPLYPDSNPLATNRIQSFDFGFSSSPVEDTWNTNRAPFGEPAPVPFGGFDNQDSFANIDTIAASNTDSLGLGISCDPNAILNYTTVPDASPMLSPVNPTNKYQAPPPLPPPMNPTSSFYVPNLPHGLPIPNMSSTREYVPTTPRRHGPSRSPSPSRSRKASAGGARRASRSRRTRSTNSTTATPRHTQRDGGGFVNFTPQDSSKILNGVAPSGSSKTKARREKEAADKRRRLSQAAMRAVLEAGGDVEALKQAGLIAA